MEISKEEFEAYLKVINTGKYNAITDAEEASKEAVLTLELWFKIIDNFDGLAEFYRDSYENN